MAGEDAEETIDPRTTAEAEGNRSWGQSLPAEPEDRRESKGFMAAGFLLLAALIVLVHLLVIYRS